MPSEQKCSDKGAHRAGHIENLHRQRPNYVSKDTTVAKRCVSED